MKDYIQKAKQYLTSRPNKELYIGIGVIACAIIAVVVVIVSAVNSVPRIVYQPAVACDLLTSQKAQELLGDQAVKSNVGEPVQSNNVSLSRCGYTNGSGDETTLVVAAIIVRSGINDKGVEQNKTEFIAGKPNVGAETVTDLGDGAYFNQKSGQLNVLSGRDWIIISYGVGSDPQSNTVEDAVTAARKVIAREK